MKVYRDVAYYDDTDAMNELKQAVLRNPLVYGSNVTKDLQATLITVDFNDDQVDYSTVFHQIRDLIKKVEGDNVHIRAVGDPILYGWVGHFLPETMQLVALALFVTLALLFLFLRTWRGVTLPFLAGVVSAAWELGICNLLNINLSIVIVVAMLITSRAVVAFSKIVNRFDDRLSSTANADLQK